MSETKTYSGGCHCGRVRYDVDADLSQVTACNCSICRKRGALMAFAPAENFRLGSGAEVLTDYQFNKKIIHHLFCATCGVGSFARGKGANGAEMIAINVHCLDGVDPATLNIKKFDGASL